MSHLVTCDPVACDKVDSSWQIENHKSWQVVNRVCFITFYQINRINSLDMSIYIAETYYPAPVSWSPVTRLLNLRGTRVWREVLMHRWGVCGFGVGQRGESLPISHPTLLPHLIQLQEFSNMFAVYSLLGRPNTDLVDISFLPRGRAVRDIFNKSQCFHHFLLPVCTACTLAHSCLHPTRGDFEERLIWNYE